MVKNSAFWFSYDSAFRIWPNGPVRTERADDAVKKTALYFYIEMIKNTNLKHFRLGYASQTKSA